MAYDAETIDANLDSDRQLKRAVERRLRGLAGTRQFIDPDYLEVARFCQPRLGAFVQAYGSVQAGSTNLNVTLKGTRLNSKLVDGHATFASQVLGNGMTSGLSSPSRPWFDITTSDPDLADSKAARVWLDQVKALIYAWFAGTNFYQAAKAGYLENGVFGTEAGVMMDHWRHGGVTFPLTTGEYWIGLDDALVPDSLYRRCDMTVIQMVQRFGIDKCPSKVRDDYAGGKYENTYMVFHAMEPNDLRQLGKRNARNKRYRSLYFMCEGYGCEANDPPFLAVEGFDDKPFWAARWDTVGSEPYGYSPGMASHPDSRQLQFQSLRKQQGIDYMITPALRGPAILANQNVNLMPKRITTVASIDKDSFMPIWEVRPEGIKAVAEDIGTTRQAIDRHFSVDLFQAITNMPGVQPRNVEEIAARNEEKLAQLGPVVDRTNTEKLKVAIDRAFMILLRQGKIPPAPRELQGQPLEIVFISTLTQAQRLLGLGGIERGLAFVGSLVGVFPQAGDKVDVDEAIDAYFDMAGTPAKIIRSEEEVQALRNARAQAQAGQQAAQQAAVVAPAANQAAQAAQTLSETDTTGGRDLLTKLMGRGG